ncbi:putative diacylglycerol kinase iota-like [Capsicum annuum]|nr:putative diacylglycerol kinase iota-like [Capsicum annuum]KAF3679335.1 putative diacylglycerol kinase iota-like [Capsicum annuum]
MDFNYLIGDYPRNAKDFYHFVPQMEEPKDASGPQLAPLLSIQVTLFPNLGISIGFTNNHVAGDRATILRFVIKDPYGQGMSIWEEMKTHNLEMCDIVTPPEHRVRADCRTRFNPSLPQSYFGNCLVAYLVKLRHVDLAGKEGFMIGAEIIGEAIQKRLKDEEWILNCTWFRQFSNIDWNPCFSVTGSPKHHYAAHFGWGRSAKLEFISLDNDDELVMSLSKSKDFDGDLEIGLSLSKTRMNALAAIFTHGLSFL